MGAFDKIEDSHVCVDVFNAWMDTKCKDLFSDRVSSESVEDAISLSKKTQNLVKYSGQDWWRLELAKYANNSSCQQETDKGNNVLPPSVGAKHYFGSHNNREGDGFLPLVLTEHSSKKSGVIYTGFVLSSPLINDIEGE